MASEEQRTHLAALMRYLVAHEPQVHYAEQRPMDTVRLSEAALRRRLGAGGSITMDCSEAVTALCHWAELRDPNGRNYNGVGYTGTLLAYLPHYSDPRGALTGALVVFGPSPGHHVAMVLEPDAEHGNPLLFSHGQERGPLLIRLHDEERYQPRPITLLSIAGL